MELLENHVYYSYRGSAEYDQRILNHYGGWSHKNVFLYCKLYTVYKKPRNFKFQLYITDWP